MDLINPPSSSIYIIAEAGVNHNGSIDLAKKLVEIAKQCGANAVKFQSFKASSLACKNAPKAAYQQKTTTSSESQFEMLTRLELNENDHHVLNQYANERSIDFLSSPFDLSSVALLTERLALPRLKIPSGQITHAPLLLAAASSGLPLIVSTGMATLGEIEASLGVIAFGYTERELPPSSQTFRSAYESTKGQAALQQLVTLLHCTSEYPTPYQDANLRAMDSLRHAFGLPVGLSDHTEGIAVALAAAARGATVIEKHFTVDKSLPGPDHQASVDPNQLNELVQSIRQIELSLQRPGRKLTMPSEHQNRDVVRQSLVANTKIKKGDPFTPINLGVKRPGTGISPFMYWNYLGEIADRDYEVDEQISKRLQEVQS